MNQAERNKAGMTGFPPIVRRWIARGVVEELCGIDCFVIDTGNAAQSSDQAVLWLHGFPSSSLDWRAIIDGLADNHRHVLIDFPGFGYSAKPLGQHYSYSLIDQADRVVLMLVRRGIKRVQLIAHDMGTSVACELLARQAMGLLPVTVESLVLTNGSVYIEQAHLTRSQKLLRSPLAGLYSRLAHESIFRWQIRKILGRPISEAELGAMWQLMNYRNGLATLPDTIRYVDERYRFYRRWTDPLATLDIPVQIIWGRLDPVAVAAIGQRLADTIPGATLTWLEHCGHFPMLEDPAAFTTVVSDFLQRK